MKKIKNFIKENRFWAGVLAIILLTLAVLAVIDSNEELNVGAYGGNTSFSAEASGYKGLYTSLEKAGEISGAYKTVRNSKSARFLEDDALYICPVYSADSLFSVNDPADLMEKVKNGSTLVLLIDDYDLMAEELAEEESDWDLSDSSDDEEESDEELSDYEKYMQEYYETALAETPWYFATTPEEYAYWLLYFAEGGTKPVSSDGLLPDSSAIESYSLEGLEATGFEYGEGRVLVSKCLNCVSNEDLMEDSEPGAALLLYAVETAADMGYDTLVFGEHYCSLYETEEWDILGGGFIMCLAELGVAAVVFLIYKAQRFGAPEKLPEVERRSETESVEALANLYRIAGIRCEPERKKDADEDKNE